MLLQACIYCQLFCNLLYKISDSTSDNISQKNQKNEENSVQTDLELFRKKFVHSNSE
jgi:hypothetical protein